MFSRLSDKLFKNKQGTIIVSIILGLGLASIFKKVCLGDECLVVKSPPMDLVQKSIYRHDDKCYKYKAETSTCNKDAIETE